MPIILLGYALGRPPHPPLYLRHLERYELGTKYTEIVGRVKRLLLRSPIRERLDYSRLLIDSTGVGRPVVDSFKAEGIRPISITIHGGSTVTHQLEGPLLDGLRVPKRDLVAAVQALLQNGRLQIAEALPLADVLKKELLSFRVKIDPRTAHDSYEHWREQDHDDLSWRWRAQHGTGSTQTAKSKPTITDREVTGYPSRETRAWPVGGGCSHVAHRTLRTSNTPLFTKCVEGPAS